ncbi:DUF2283 domain-containing protein [Leptolyngbya sp. NIES-2104]|uniref:DUF2283 domain-containing protein n=1 Tax=Leptolyngbya sp. NIES-2104 TaxID=1552121 RepID=UPI0006EC9683|nr:DUF2283 domain-containing protein [Leptolyngbya sp. NIES-2104]GAP97735.1 hypothetical protein NIES2104_42820 [Leptolyngbya sp. NIES-2104]
MKVTYDSEVDILTILLSDAASEDSREDSPGVILDYDIEGNLIGLEILNASKRVENPLHLEHVITGISAQI